MIAQRLFQTRPDLSLLAARLTLGVVMFPHGAQKVLGLFGGHGLEATIAGMSKGFPVPLVILAIAAEFLGSIGLVLGLLSRVAAFGIACTMAVAVASTHLKNGFFMNWMGNQAGEGFEYHILAIGLAVVTMIAGAGALSVDGLIANRLGGKRR